MLVNKVLEKQVIIVITSKLFQIIYLIFPKNME